MKKIVSLMLCLLMVIGIVGCGKTEGEKEEEKPQNVSAEFKTNVTAGKIPEVKFAVGTAASELDKYYSDTEKAMEEAHNGGGEVHSDDDMLLSSVEGFSTHTYEIGSEKYFYEKSKKDKGVSVICSLGDAYGFKHGTSKADVEAALEGLELQTLKAGESELYFVPLIEAVILRYTEGDIRVDFYFNNNELVATTLLNFKNWTI